VSVGLGSDTIAGLIVIINCSLLIINLILIIVYTFEL